MLTFLNTLSTLVLSGGNIGNLLLWIIGVAIVFAIFWFIIKQLALPPLAYTVLYVIGAIVLLLLVIEFFFGSSGSSGPVLVR